MMEPGTKMNIVLGRQRSKLVGDQRPFSQPALKCRKYAACCTGTEVRRLEDRVRKRELNGLEPVTGAELGFKIYLHCVLVHRAAANNFR